MQVISALRRHRRVLDQANQGSIRYMLAVGTHSGRNVEGAEAGGL